MDQTALIIQMKYANGLILFKNCSFRFITQNTKQVIYGEIVTKTNSVAVMFENCMFYNNVVLVLLEMIFVNYNSLYVHPSNVTIIIENCNFIENNGDLLVLTYDPIDHHCNANVFFNKVTNFAKNEADFLTQISNMVVNMNGTITVLENTAIHNILEFFYCNITFTKTTTFLSNICVNVINLISLNIPYIIVMENTSVTFTNNTHDQLVFGASTLLHNHDVMFPYCFFQYMVLTNDTDKYDISKLLKLYTISFNENKVHKWPTALMWLIK